MGSVAWTLSVISLLSITLVLSVRSAPTWLIDLMVPLTSILGFVVFVLIVAAFIKFYEAASHLSSLGPLMRAGRVGVLLIIGEMLFSYISSWVIVAGTRATAFSGLSAVLIQYQGWITAVGSAIRVTGGVLFAAMMLGLSERERVGEFGIGGILYLAMLLLDTAPVIGISGVQFKGAFIFLRGVIGLSSMLMIHRASGILLERFR